MTDSAAIWCEHCRAHYPTDHYDEDGQHKVGKDYGPKGYDLECREIVEGRASRNRVRCFDSLCTLAYGHRGPHFDRRDEKEWPNYMDDEDKDAIPNRAAEYDDAVPGAPGWSRPESIRTPKPERGAPRTADATPNSVPTEDEIAEVMASCWDHDDFKSNRAANGYPRMAKALRAYLLERAT